MRLHRSDLRKTLGELQSNSETQRYFKTGIGRVLKLCERHDPIFTCQFIEGTPTKQELRRNADKFKCGAPAKTNSAYCEPHHARCYIKALTPDDQPPASDITVKNLIGWSNGD